MSWVPQRGELIADKYRIDGLIGAGGMGAVLRATHLTLLQPVAIKVLRPDDDPTAITRFLREARAAAALSNAHVMRVLDVGEITAEMPYLVMEYLDGENLSQRLARGPIPQEEVLEIFSQVCDGLGEAHAKGIVHRDIKPSNIFLVAATDTGRVTSSKGKRSGVLAKVVDFGIAKPIDPDVSVEQSLTGTSQVLGTPRYMSPEQMSAAVSADARADVWAVGVSLYEALAGKPPFDGATSYEIGAQILMRDPPPLRERRPDLLPVLERVVDRCLRKNPDERFADANEVLAALQAPEPIALPLPQANTGPSPIAAPAIASTANAPLALSHDITPAGRRMPGSSLAVAAGLLLGLSALVALLVVKPFAPKPTAQPLVAASADPVPVPVPATVPSEEPTAADVPAGSTSVIATVEEPAPSNVRRGTAKPPPPRRPPPRPATRPTPALTGAPDER
ncbi:MAG: serine/threonine-protein kinase [Labilithrix sp.]